MKSRILALMAAVALLPAAAAAQSQQTVSEDSVSVALATVLGNLVKQNINSFEQHGFTIDYDRFSTVFATVLRGGDTGITPRAANEFISGLMMKTAPRPAVDTVSVASQQQFADSVLVANPKAVKTASGLVFVTLTEGSGPHPADTDKVEVKYVARLSDGTVFDDTEGETVEFDVNRLIPGFTEGLKMMQPGGTYRMIIPADIAYGPDGIAGVIPGNSALDFTVTLEKIK